MNSRARKPCLGPFGTLMFVLLSLVILPAAFGVSAWAVPIAMTSSKIDIFARVLGGGPYKKQLPNGPELDLGNGITFKANPAATALAGAASLARASSPADFVQDLNADLGRDGETDAEVLERISKLFPLDTGGRVVLHPLKASGTGSNIVANASGASAESGDHRAQVSGNRIAVNREGIVRDGGPAHEPNEIGEFTSRQETSARASDNTLHFAEAFALNQGFITGVLLQNRFNTQFSTPENFAPKLELEWKITDITLQAVPTVSKAFMRHEVLITSVFQDQRVGFQLRMEDGKLVESTFFETGAGKTDIQTWFANNAGPVADDTYKLKAGARPALTLQLPLNGLNLKDGIVISPELENRNYEFSFEEPPRANHKAKEDAGNTPNPAPGPLPAPGPGTGLPNMHWNAATGTLTFDDAPINILTQGAGGIDPRYAGDPVLQAHLHLDPLVFAFAEDGRKYFAGGGMSITDGVTDFFEASLPMLVLDESLHTAQGLNMFAPLVDLTFDFDHGSTWVQDYFKRMGSGEPLTPQFFVGLSRVLAPVGGLDAFGSSFDASADLDLSFCTPVPEPTSFLLVTSGLVGVMWVRRHRRPSGRA